MFPSGSAGETKVGLPASLTSNMVILSIKDPLCARTLSIISGTLPASNAI